MATELIVAVLSVLGTIIVGGLAFASGLWTGYLKYKSDDKDS